MEADSTDRRARVERLVVGQIESVLPHALAVLVAQFDSWDLPFARELASHLTQPKAISWFQSAHVTREEFWWLVTEAAIVFMREDETLLNLDPLRQSQWCVLGNIYGDYSCLIQYLQEFGVVQPAASDPFRSTILLSPYRKLLFLGGLIDRGENSIDALALVCALKIAYPSLVYFIRGEHECASMNRIYGFYQECKRVFDIKCWRQASRLFNSLPLAAVLGERVFCVHGGLSPDQKLVLSQAWKTTASESDINMDGRMSRAGTESREGTRVWRSEALDAVARIRRPADVPDDGLMCDLLWSSPDPDASLSGWGCRDKGISYDYGTDVLDRFLQETGLQWMLRAQQVVEDGYECKSRYCTLFSTPNFVDSGNLGAGLILTEGHQRCQVVTLRRAAGGTQLAEVAVCDMDVAVLHGKSQGDSEPDDPSLLRLLSSCFTAKQRQT